MVNAYDAAKLKRVFSKLNSLKVFVIGDAMIDNYWIGSIERISPEAPVPVVSVTNKISLPGGAANVALNCQSMGASVYLLSVLGKDKNANDLCNQLDVSGINTEYIMYSKERITTTKTRVLSKNQQMIRLDEESIDELSQKEEHLFIDICLKAIQIEKPSIVIFEDYNKGVLKKNVIEKVIAHCKHLQIFTAVDPKKSNFLSYEGANLFKPNLKEVKEALHLSNVHISLKSLKSIHTKLMSSLSHQITMITLSEDGIFAQQEETTVLFPSHRRVIADVSGAGDTVIAVASMVYSVTKDLELTTHLANLAGGLVCEEVGVAPINKNNLLQEALLILKP